MATCDFRLLCFGVHTCKGLFCLTWDVHYLASITLQDSPHQKIKEKSSTHRDSKHILLNVWCIDRCPGTS
jgi:hypothetical protein